MTPQKVQAYVAAVKRETGRDVVSVRVMGDGGVELRLAGDDALNPADLVKMDD
jgi:hypothetical protein